MRTQKGLSTIGAIIGVVGLAAVGLGTYGLVTGFDCGSCATATSADATPAVVEVASEGAKVDSCCPGDKAAAVIAASAEGADCAAACEGGMKDCATACETACEGMAAADCATACEGMTAAACEGKAEACGSDAAAATPVALEETKADCPLCPSAAKSECEGEGETAPANPN